jgi:hypothetical protein
MTLRNGSSIPSSAYMLDGLGRCNDCECFDMTVKKLQCVVGLNGPTEKRDDPPRIALFMRTYVVPISRPLDKKSTRWCGE